ncbi:hypothetical protein P175DRAFT_0508176 [Aspergillus ochraceoroseus IBT 24754]|nr:uncharacterized protein P175DRAFT_0508176 [Aspergillus ochraceoroseus IBT 24754]PTU23504.1 hypothetical protein P175DRAFT_0508176 [Aspergillus ochraceoroseus IBT 24754]
MSQSHTLDQLEDILPHAHHTCTSCAIPETTASRQRASIAAQSLDQDGYLPEKVSEAYRTHDINALSPEKTVFYLAYGSNLASETFLGRRGIKPLSQLNVIVPGLRLTFDLAGLPYTEPCFAGTHFRDPASEQPCEATPEADDTRLPEEQSLLTTSDRDQQITHPPKYKGPLIGVVYEVTLTDYAKIIATEGGGRGYKDIIVDCYPFPHAYDPADPIPEHPTTEPIKAHTLLSPAAQQELVPRRTRSRWSSPPNIRPNPYWAQPSARYLNLLTTGAEEHNLPLVYREYLAQIKTYRITTVRQRIGKAVFIATWGPWLLLMLALSRIFAGPDGRSPPWVARYGDTLVSMMWAVYDNVYVHVFGDGERTIGE